LLIFNASILVVPDSVLLPAIVWSPLVLTTVASTSILFALAVIPLPPITLSVTSPDAPPPVKPSPALTPVMSAALLLAIVIVLPTLLIDMP
jgi:hypothetical protein